MERGEVVGEGERTEEEEKWGRELGGGEGERVDET